MKKTVKPAAASENRIQPHVPSNFIETYEIVKGKSVILFVDVFVVSNGLNSDSKASYYTIDSANCRLCAAGNIEELQNQVRKKYGKFVTESKKVK